MFNGEFGQSLKAGTLCDLVVIRPGDKQNSLSLMDGSVLEDTNMALGARCGSAILKIPWIICTFFISGRGCNKPPSFYLPIEMLVMKLTYFMELSTV